MNIKRIFGGVAYLSLASLVGRLFSILSFPILTRILQPEADGVAALATTIISVLTIVGVFGQDTSYAVGYNDVERFDREQVDQFYARYGWITGGVFGISAACVWLVLAGMVRAEASLWVCVFVAIGVAGGIVSSLVQMRARLLDCYLRLAIAQLVSGVGSTLICILAAWAWRPDETALMMAATSYWVLVAILPTVRLRDLVGASKSTTKQFGHLIKIGAPLVGNSLGYWFISSSDKWFLAAYLSKAQVGIYAVGVTVASLGQMVTSALVSVWTPELFRHLRDGELTNKVQLSRILTFMIWMIITTCFGIALFGDLIIRILAGPSFQSAANYVPTIALAYMFYGINQLIGFGLVLRRKSGIFPVIWVTGVAISLSLNAILVPRLGTDGAALIQCVTFGLVVLITWIVARPHTPFQPFWRGLFATAAIYLTALALLQLMPATPSLLEMIALRSVVALTATGIALMLVLQSFGAPLAARISLLGSNFPTGHRK